MPTPSFDCIRINDGPRLIDNRSAAEYCGFHPSYFSSLQRAGVLWCGIAMPTPIYFRGGRYYAVEELAEWLQQFGSAGPRRKRGRRRSTAPEQAAVGLPASDQAEMILAPVTATPTAAPVAEANPVDDIFGLYGVEEEQSVEPNVIE